MAEISYSRRDELPESWRGRRLPEGPSATTDDYMTARLGPDWRARVEAGQVLAILPGWTAWLTLRMEDVEAWGGAGPPGYSSFGWAE